jgi:uncharacterized protein YceH (UPF0502 family)
MNIRLSAVEARIIGSLIEKQITTPDQYPLSLNALVNACNQKSNREPAMQLTESEVKKTMEILIHRHFVVEKSGFGSRVPKYAQIFCNTEFGSLRFTALETGIVCELLVRGPQTPGELRTRVQRLAESADPEAIDASLEALANRPGGALVQQLPRESGRRDSRWAQLFEELPEVTAAPEGEAPMPSAPRAAAGSSAASELAGRVEKLESEVAELRLQIESLRRGPL